MKFKSLDDIKNKADVVFLSKTGDDKFVFLVDNAPSLSEIKQDTKGGKRVKGKKYFGNPIYVDFYEHRSIKSGDGDYADILIAESIEDAKKQFKAYRDGKTHIHKMEIKKSVGVGFISSNTGIPQEMVVLLEQESQKRKPLGCSKDEWRKIFWTRTLNHWSQLQNERSFGHETETN